MAPIDSAPAGIGRRDPMPAEPGEARPRRHDPAHCRQSCGCPPQAHPVTPCPVPRFGGIAPARSRRLPARPRFLSSAPLSVGATLARWAHRHRGVGKLKVTPGLRMGSRSRSDARALWNGRRRHDDWFVTPGHTPLGICESSGGQFACRLGSIAHRRCPTWPRKWCRSAFRPTRTLALTQAQTRLTPKPRTAVQAGGPLSPKRRPN